MELPNVHEAARDRLFAPHSIRHSLCCLCLLRADEPERRPLANATSSAPAQGRAAAAAAVAAKASVASKPLIYALLMRRVAVMAIPRKCGCQASAAQTEIGRGGGDERGANRQKPKNRAGPKVCTAVAAEAGIPIHVLLASRARRHRSVFPIGVNRLDGPGQRGSYRPALTARTPARGLIRQLRQT